MRVVLAFALLSLGVRADEGTGSVRVKTDVPGAEVALDNRVVGETPMTIPNVPAGKHELRLTKPGYRAFTQEVEVKSGQTSRVFAVLQPAERPPLPDLPAKFTAIHVHASGYCRGEITVTAEALDYRELDGKDVFHIPSHEMKSVARSAGAMPGLVPQQQGVLMQPMAARVEAPGRNYSFYVYEDTPEKTWSKLYIDAYMQQKTAELYELLYRLWTEKLESKRAPAR